MSNPPIPPEPAVETVPVTATPRTRLPDLLRGPFDIRSLALSGLFVLALFYTLFFMRSILLPIVLAWFLSYLLTPVVRLLARARIGTGLGAAMLLLGMIGLVFYGFSVLSVPAAGWLEKAPYSLQQLQQKLLPIRKPMAQVAQATSEIEKLTAPDDQKRPPTVEIKQGSLLNTLYVQGPEFVVSFVFTLILLYFLLAYDGVFLAKLLRLMPRLADKKRAVSIARDIESQVSRYLLTITVINCSLGLAVGIAVYFLGLPNPIMWGVLVAILNFVPYVGALVGIICMTLAAILSFDSFGYALLFPAVYLALTTIEGQVVTPMVLGRSLTLNPIIVLLSLAFWGWMWGVAGIILAVPILAAFKILCSHVEGMEPVADFVS